jgi:hypothetical protein
MFGIIISPFRKGVPGGVPGRFNDDDDDNCDILS